MYFFFFSLFLGFLSLIYSGGCIQVEDKDSTSTSIQHGEKSEEEYFHKEEEASTKPLILELLPGDFISEYSVFLTWQENPQFKKWLIKKHIAKEENSEFTEALEPQALSWLDKDILEGQKIQYQLWGITFSEERELLGSQEIYILTDMLIDGNQKIGKWQDLLKSDKPIGRLVFLNNASLQIGDKDLKLRVKELYAKEGRLLSFPLGKKASVGKKGKNGGSIEIHAEKAEGTLHFQLHGEIGGDGQKGSNLGASGKGRKGADGKPAQYTIYQRRIMDIFEDKILCQSISTNGQPGGRGKKGTSGKSGKKGGNSSPLYLEIKEGSHFQFTLESSPGRGGEGGMGGPGGEGGKGGATGHSEASQCKGNAQAGKKGPQGPSGSQGKRGASGKNSSICIKINGIEQLGCYDRKK